MTVRFIFGTTLLLALAITVGDASRTDAPAVHAQSTEASFEGSTCGGQLPGGQPTDNAICGWLTVPETRGSGDGRTVRLPVIVLKSTSSDPEPDPVVYLTGGPGAPALNGAFQFWGRPENAAFIQSTRDYIFFDQRGTGLSQPGLYCPETSDVLIEALKSGREGSYLHELQREQLRACHDRLTAEGVNFASYNSTASAHDIADLMTRAWLRRIQPLRHVIRHAPRARGDA
jgi:pimeloyl-ACP methyl ester carboxylesterase